MVDERALAQLLEEAADAHHQAYLLTDGADDDWASWYADWLLDHAARSEAFGSRPDRDHLVRALVQLDGDFARDAPRDPWSQYYASRLPQLLAG